MATVILQILGGFLLLLVATIVFDILHWLLHAWTGSRYSLLRAAGALHQTHHRFLDRELVIHDELLWRNVWHHVVPEYLVQLSVTLAFLPLVPQLTVITALALETLVFILIMWGKPGVDVNHHPVDRLLPYRPLYFCVPEYHLLHHRYPDAHFSSWIKTLDHWLGTGMSLHRRRILMTGANTDFGREMHRALQACGANVAAINTVDLQLFSNAEVLLLCHPETTATDYEGWMTAFYEQHHEARYPVEIWALARGDDERLAQAWLYGGRVNYRHIDITAAQATAEDVELILKNIKRGFNLVPVRSVFAAVKRYGQLLRK